MSTNENDEDDYQIQLMSLRTAFLRPTFKRVTPSLNLSLDLHQNDARLPLIPKMVLKSPSIEQNSKHTVTVRLRQKAKRRMSSRPTVKQIDNSENLMDVFFRIPWSKIPENKGLFYDSIRALDPTLDEQDILFLQYYPYLPLHRIHKTQFIDKQLHASFHFESKNLEEVQRLYYVDRIQRKPTYSDLPL